MNSLTDRVVLITGASSGIGRCLAIQLAAQGARLALCGRSEEKLDRVVAELESAGRPPALPRAFCLSSEGLTKVVRKEAKASGVKVTSVHPGGTDTDFRPANRPEYMSPESVAEAIVSILTLPDDAVVHDLVLRPPVEDNFV